MNTIVSIKNLSKTYAGGFQALKDINLDVREGEILALLGPNGAGKTTLISIICGIINASGGTVTVGGYDIRRDFRKTRALIGLVPQELPLGQWDRVWNTAAFSRGLFGRPPDDALVARTLRDLSLWDKRNSMVQQLSGGMKRRLLIAKALVHEPRVLFLDEPTAGVDVALRRDTWKLIDRLRRAGVTIILTTHYIDEAEAMADRVGVINHGELLLVENKRQLMCKLGKKRINVELLHPITAIPAALAGYQLALSDDGVRLTYAYDIADSNAGHEFAVTVLLKQLSEAGLTVKDITTRETSLEEIFVDLVRDA